MHTVSVLLSMPDLLNKAVVHTFSESGEVKTPVATVFINEAQLDTDCIGGPNGKVCAVIDKGRT